MRLTRSWTSKNTYLENSSRRNNVKIFGIPEKDQKDGKETWEECEIKAIEAIRKKLEITDDLKIERVHRVGKPRPKFRHIEGYNNREQACSRPIVIRFQSSKGEEMVVRAARRIRPEAMQFFEDFSKRTLGRRKENIPELIKKRKEGKKVFLIKDKLVEYDETKS